MRNSDQNNLKPHTRARDDYPAPLLAAKCAKSWDTRSASLKYEPCEQKCPGVMFKLLERRLHTQRQRHTHTHTFNKYTHTYMHVYTYLFTYTYVYMNKYVYVYIYIYMHRGYVCMCVYVCMWWCGILASGRSFSINRSRAAFAAPMGTAVLPVP